MSEMIKIRNGGVETLVHIDAYNSIYKAKGWEIIGEDKGNELDNELKSKGISDEQQQNAYIKIKREKTGRHFNDGLFKED